LVVNESKAMPKLENEFLNIRKYRFFQDCFEVVFFKPQNIQQKWVFEGIKLRGRFSRLGSVRNIAPLKDFA